MNISEIPIGTGMTKIVGSDRYPYVVVRKTAKCLFVKAAAAGRNKATWPEQGYDIDLENPAGNEIKLVHTVNGWVGHGLTYIVGADYYMDPSF